MTTQDFKEIYDELALPILELGCIMINTDPLKVSDLVDEEDLYFTQDSSKFWVNGIVSEWGTPHVTLKWGLLQSGKVWGHLVDKVLEGWSINSVEVEEVGYFESTYQEESYFCIIAHLKVTDELKDAYYRLSFLPHIDNFPEYKPHITLCYIKDNPEVRDKLVSDLNERYKNKKIKTKDLNYGK